MRRVKLTKEQVMVARGIKERGTSVRQLARQLEVTEGALRYRLRKLEEGSEEPDLSPQGIAPGGVHFPKPGGARSYPTCP